MEKPTAPFFFSLHADDEEETFLGYFVGLEDFFTGSSSALSEFDDGDASELCDQGVWLRSRLVGLNPSDALVKSLVHGKGRLGEVWISIHNSDGKVIGSYFVGSAAFEEWTESSDHSAVGTLSCWISELPERSAGELWKKWSRQAPESVSEWTHLPLGEREGWIEVARKYAGITPRVKNATGDYLLEGHHVNDLASFYCAIGEAMIGPGGYYGSNLASLDDCLFGGHGPTAPFRLVWQDSSVALRALGDVATSVENKTVMEAILECLDRRGVVVELA